MRVSYLLYNFERYILAQLVIDYDLKMVNIVVDLGVLVQSIAYDWEKDRVVVEVSIVGYVIVEDSDEINKVLDSIEEFVQGSVVISEEVVEEE